MTIYGEYLFLENFVTGIMILFFTGKIMGCRIHPFRYFLCGCGCGAYAFVIFLPMGGIVSWVWKLAFSFLMTRVAFGSKNRKLIFQGAMVFLGITILYGGITIALLTSFSRTGVTAAAGVYLAPLTYLGVTTAAGASALFLCVLLETCRVRRIAARRLTAVTALLEGKSWILQGLIDSGNDLRDPLTGRPVCIIDRDKGEKILEESQISLLDSNRYAAIPYRAVGVSHGILEGFRIDRLELQDGTVIKRPVLAFCEEGHFGGTKGEVEILLPADLLERGIYGDY